VRPVTSPTVILPGRVDATGNAILRRRGLLGRPIVCLQVRDSAFRPDHPFRNSDIQAFAQAAEYLISEGFIVVRMGIVTLERLPLRDDRIIDLFHDGLTSDGVDMFFARNAQIWLSTGSGPDSAAWVVGTPLAFVDYTLIPRALGDYVNTRTLVCPREVVSVTGQEPASPEAIARFAQTRDKTIEWQERPASSETILHTARQLVRLSRGEPLLNYDDRLQRAFWRRSGGIFGDVAADGSPPCILEPAWLVRHVGVDMEDRDHQD